MKTIEEKFINHPFAVISAAAGAFNFDHEFALDVVRKNDMSCVPVVSNQEREITFEDDKNRTLELYPLKKTLEGG